MFVSRRIGALFRAARAADHAEVARLDALQTRLLAARDDTDEESRASLVESARMMEDAAGRFDQLAARYLAMWQDADSADQADDDADGWGR